MNDAPSTLSHVPAKPLLRGWSHVVSAVIAAVLCGVMIGLAPGTWPRLAMVIYAVGLIGMFTVSSVYHRGRWSPRALRHISRLDHSAIFLAIAGTYTPVALFGTEGWASPLVLTLVWVGAVIGISLIWAPVTVPRWLFTAIYALVGWVAIVALPQLVSVLGLVGFGLILGGGICYTIGAVVYGTRRPDPWPRIFGYHEVFHAFTVVAAALHLAAVGFVVLPQAS
jgi:hemolysin III